MTDAARSPVPGRSRSRARRVAITVAVLVAIAIAIAAYLRWQRSRLGLPVIDTNGVDPAVTTALRRAEDAVRQSPRSANAWGRLGTVLLANDYVAEGKPCLVRAEELDPEDPRWPYLQAMIVRWTNPDTLPKLERAVALCGDDPPAPRLRLAESLLAQGRSAEAAAEFQRCLAVHPASPWALIGLAQAALDQDDGPAALARLAPAPVRATMPRTYHTLRAVIYQRQRQPEAAAGELSQARDLPADPPPPDPFLEELLEQAVGSTARLELAANYLRQNRATEAIALLQAAVEAHPEQDAAWLWLGRSRAQQRDLAGAEAAFRTAIAAAPAAAEPRYFLGLALLEKGDATAAVDAFRRATQFKPNYPMAYRMLSRCLQKEGDEKGAVAALRAAVRYAPHDAAAQLEAGELLARCGQKQEAAMHLRHALRLQPDNARAKQLLKEVAGPP